MTASQPVAGTAAQRLPNLDASGVRAAFGPGCDRRRRRLTGGHYVDWSDQLVDGGLAESDAANRTFRHIDGAYLKRPGRGVPPPRSGPPPLVMVTATEESHALAEHTPPDADLLAPNPTSVCRDR
jgi:hypothetical protein